MLRQTEVVRSKGGVEQRTSAARAAKLLDLSLRAIERFWKVAGRMWHDLNIHPKSNTTIVAGHARGLEDTEEHVAGHARGLEDTEEHVTGCARGLEDTDEQCTLLAKRTCRSNGTVAQREYGVGGFAN
jgi:hypothetical protein